MFSASCHYGLQAMFYIALHSSSDKNVELTEIASEQDIPKHFLSKILQLLVREKLLYSMKGPTGGFRLTKPPNEITLIEIVDAIDGLDIFHQCGIGFKTCDDQNPCPLHHDYKAIRERVKKLFSTKTLEALKEEVQEGGSIISMSQLE
ncbi:MAG: Rrf2 family transcriptional regulator [Balneolaceae bacterium]|nr:MAG: Rrf2 family transcriptional regulator [Balneolaceae bacterium]